MGVNLLTEHHLESLRLKRGCTGSSESYLSSKCYVVGNHMLWLNDRLICGFPWAKLRGFLGCYIAVFLGRYVCVYTVFQNLYKSELIFKDRSSCMPALFNVTIQQY